ncbi:MAG: DNA methyltransferase, partial [Anaerolineae bacterium]
MTNKTRKRPKTTPYSDIDLNRWREYDHVLTDSLWTIEARDRTGGHRLDYHGNFVPQIATQTFLRYTKENDVVLDLFLGSGTSAIEAVRLNRRLIGVELKPDLVEAVRAKIAPDLLDDRICLLRGDSTTPEMAARVRETLSGMGADHAQLLILHPPYCLLPGNQIFAGEHLVSIEDIQGPVQLVNKEGKRVSVCATISRQYTGEIIEISQWNYTMDTLRLTPNHRVWAIRTANCDYLGRGSDFTCKRDCGIIAHRNRKGYKLPDCGRFFESYHPEWIVADELRKGDYLLYSFDTSVSDVEVIQIDEHIDLKKVRIRGDYLY